jgi:hypothetical protein
VNSAGDLASNLDLGCCKPIFKGVVMTEEQKKEVAVFRYGVIAEFVGATRLDRGERERLLGQHTGSGFQNWKFREYQLDNLEA